jgi:hypothetical protein
MHLGIPRASVQHIRASSNIDPILRKPYHPHKAQYDVSRTGTLNRSGTDIKRTHYYISPRQKDNQYHLHVSIADLGQDGLRITVSAKHTTPTEATAIFVGIPATTSTFLSI